MNFTPCPQAVIFDMDGLLVDSEPVWESVERALIERRGLIFSSEIRLKLIGLGMMEFLTALKSAYDLPDTLTALREELIVGMRAAVPAQAHPKPGAEALIAYVQAAGLPCAVASSSPHAVIDAVMAARGWEATLRVRVSGDDVTHGKPAPDIYHEAARRLGVDPAACLALEDSPRGATAAAAAGMITVAVPDGSHTSAAAFAAITPHVSPSLTAVLAALQGAGC